MPLRGGAQEEGVRCRLKKGGEIFEVLCHAAKVELFREGAASMEDVLITHKGEIFKDISKGDHQSTTEIEKAFGHADFSKAVEEILLKGDFQLSTAERKRKTEEKLVQIVTYIAVTYIEPKTNLPIPRTRIENGIETLKGLKIEPFRSTSTQAEEIAKKLKELFPMIKNEVFGKVTVSLDLAGTTSGALHASGACKVYKDDYTDEAYFAEISWSAHDYSRLIAELTKATGGQYELVQETSEMTSAEMAAQVLNLLAVLVQQYKYYNSTNTDVSTQIIRRQAMGAQKTRKDMMRGKKRKQRLEARSATASAQNPLGWTNKKAA
jgi:ribosome maturation protein SDO1